MQPPQSSLRLGGLAVWGRTAGGTGQVGTGQVGSVRCGRPRGGGAVRSLAALPGELPVMFQPLPWQGPGLSWGQSLNLAWGASLPQSSGVPRSKTPGQCGVALGLEGRARGQWCSVSTVSGRGSQLVLLPRSSENDELSVADTGPLLRWGRSGPGVAPSGCSSSHGEVRIGWFCSGPEGQGGCSPGPHFGSLEPG